MAAPPPRQRLLAFALGAVTAAVVAAEMKMLIWRGTSTVSASRLSPPPPPAPLEVRADGPDDASCVFVLGVVPRLTPGGPARLRAPARGRRARAAAEAVPRAGVEQGAPPNATGAAPAPPGRAAPRRAGRLLTHATAPLRTVGG